jgi:hypothetical protein
MQIRKNPWLPLIALAVLSLFRSRRDQQNARIRTAQDTDLGANEGGGGKLIGGRRLRGHDLSNLHEIAQRNGSRRRERASSDPNSSLFWMNEIFASERFTLTRLAQGSQILGLSLHVT